MKRRGAGAKREAAGQKAIFLSPNINETGDLYRAFITRSKIAAKVSPLYGSDNRCEGSQMNGIREMPTEENGVVKRHVCSTTRCFPHRSQSWGFP